MKKSEKKNKWKVGTVRTLIKSVFFMLKQRCKYIVVGVAGAVMVPGIAMAVGEVDPDAVMDNFLKWLFNIMAFVGAICLVLGIYHTLMSIFSSHDPEQKMRGVWLIVTGIGLMGIRAITAALGVSVV